MSQDREQQIKLEFLQESLEYLDTIESGLLGLGNSTIAGKSLDAVLRAAHSIKGGAAMMGFTNLSDLAHRLEDCLKVLKAGKAGAANVETERLFLTAVDRLRQISERHRQGTDIDPSWLVAEVNPLFEQLHALLGEPQPEAANTLFSEVVEQDMRVLLFETEVETCLGRLEALLANPKQPSWPAEFALAAQELGGLGEILGLSAFTLDSAFEDSSLAVESIESLLESGDFQTGMQDLFSSLETFSEGAPAANAAREVEPATPEPEPTPVATLIPVPQQPELQLEPLTAAAQEETADNTIRVSARQLEQLGELLGELTIERNGLQLELRNLHQLLRLLRQKVHHLERSNADLRDAYDRVPGSKPRLLAGLLVGSQDPQRSQPPSQPGNAGKLNNADFQFDLLEMDRYSELHSLSVEVMDTIVQVEEVTSDLELNLDEAEKTARDLTRTAKLMQTNVTQMRMRPLSDLVARFPRALRNMALEYGKEVELKLEGGATLIDRTILEALNDPLLHLIRNAFAHGIEDPATRLARGKPERGTIAISATYRSNQTVIAIRDDGAGINWDKVRARAVQMGFDATALAQANERELLELIFEPGFSTADRVTGLSGRGIGMDVVRTNLQPIGGQVQIDSQPDLGTTVMLTVPFRMSVLPVMLVENQGMLLAFPSNAVAEMLPLQPESLLTCAGQEALNWEGEIVPLILLNQWLRYPRSRTMSEIGEMPVIDGKSVLLTTKGDELIGIQVERYWGEQEVTVRQVEGNLNLPPGFSGCTILGDGRVVPLLDVLSLLEWIEERRLGQAIQPVEASPSVQQSWLETEEEPTVPLPPPQERVLQKDTIMVVDDSITVRRFLALTLEKAGYRVEQAKDGQDALEKLQGEIHIQAVICDIEMPRLDGYGVLAKLKSDPSYQELPVIMLTSRSSTKHRQLAMNLGANAYLTKPFQEQDLLQTLQQLLK